MGLYLLNRHFVLSLFQQVVLKHGPLPVAVILALFEILIVQPLPIFKTL